MNENKNGIEIQTTTADSTLNSKYKYVPAMALLTSLFFMWGFITCLNDILVPHLKSLFDLNYTKVMLIQFSFFGAYFIMSIPSGWIIGKIGYKKGIVAGLSTSGIGCLLFYPAAALISYPLFLMALFILASGITVLQVAANPYVAILGKPETASSRLNLTQGFNSLGHTTAPLIGSYLILANHYNTPLQKAESVQIPYIGLALTLFIIAVIIYLAKLPSIEAQTTRHNNGNSSFVETHKSVWSYKHLVLGAAAIFLYVGGEVSIGSFLVNYFGDKNIANLPPDQAGNYVSFYWGAAMVGRFIGSALLQRIKPQKLLSFNAVAAIVLVLTSVFSTGSVAMWSILAVGFFNSIMFGNIFTLSISNLGTHTSQGSGILCSAIVGGAIIPVIQGAFADAIGVHHAFLITILCYGFVLFYGLKGYAQDTKHK